MVGVAQLGEHLNIFRLFPFTSGAEKCYFTYNEKVAGSSPVTDPSTPG